MGLSRENVTRAPFHFIKMNYKDSQALENGHLICSSDMMMKY